LIAAALIERVHLAGGTLEVDAAMVANEFSVAARLVWGACTALETSGLVHTEIGLGGNRILRKAVA
jgi:hypothetical protein